MESDATAPPPGASEAAETIVQRMSTPPFDGSAVTGLPFRGAADRVPASGGVALAAGGCATFDTLLGAFPGAWWREATGADHVVCRMIVSAPATVTFLRSDETGAVVERVAVDSAAGEVEHVCALPAETGGWVWFEVRAHDNPVLVSDVRWSLPVPLQRPATAAVCITTFDREVDCLGVLRAVSAAEDLETCVRRVIVVDQGSRALRDVAGFDEVAAALGDRLSVVRQPNLGGSGGFSRGMFAALEDEVEFVLLLDDDVRVDPESIRRMVAFGAAARNPTMVGAQMMSLVDPTVLHSFGERVDLRRMAWRPVAPSLSTVDLAATEWALPAFHRRQEVDFNGWWMCLVPVDVIRRHGAALPLFIKWDDTEFALRAREAGVPTVTLPGAVVWHMPWTAKDDGLDWQAYFQLRNRLVTALLHGDGGAGVLAASFAQDVNHILCQQYGSAAVRRLALRDVLSGPAHLPGSLLRRPHDVRTVLAKAGQAVSELPSAPTRPPVRPPRGAFAAMTRVARVLLHQLRAPRRHERPAPVLPRQDGKWWSVGLLDEVVVASATGVGGFRSRRDRTAALSLSRDAVVDRIRLARSWRRLSRDYRAARDDLAGRATWDAILRDAVVSRG